MKLDTRRWNDIIRALGPILGVLNEVLPLLPEGRFKHVLTGFSFALMFLGVRGPGMEYKSVAKAEATAAVQAEVIKRLSVQPPPMPSLIVTDSPPVNDVVTDESAATGTK